MPDNILETDILIIKSLTENKIEVLTAVRMPDEFDKELMELIKKYLKK